MIDMDYKMIGPGTYQKWNPKTLVRTTVKFEGELMHVRHEQPKWVQQTILDDNQARKNDFAGYGNADAYNGIRAPMPVWQQIMKQCGFKQGQGYDQKKFRQIVNDSDYSKLKVVPGKI
jgi:hypothetical protein